MEWHDSSETVSALRSLVKGRGGVGLKLRKAKEHAGNFARKHLPIGRVMEMIDDPIPKQQESGLFFAGYQEYQSEAEDVDPEVFEDLIAEKLAQLDSTVDLEHFNLKALKDQMRFLLERGVVPIYHLPPSFGDSRTLYALEAAGVVPKLIAFDDPRLHPELWRIESRQDTHHLRSGEASRRFTRSLAEAVHEEILLRKDEYVRSLEEIIGS